MKIILRDPSDGGNTPYRSLIDTDHDVIIENPARGPILTNGTLCLSMFARDDGFEGYLWDQFGFRGYPSGLKTLSENHQAFIINRSGLFVRK